MARVEDIVIIDTDKIRREWLDENMNIGCITGRAMCDEIDRLRKLTANGPKTNLEVIYALQRILDECIKSTDGRVSIIAHDALVRARALATNCHGA